MTAAGTTRRSVTIKDVARAAGVHPSTVSRSLDPRQSARVSTSTRDRVQQLAREMHYRPDIWAAGFRQQRSRTIGVVIPDFGNPIYAQLIRGISVQLEREGYVALIVETRDEADGLRTALETLEARRADGIITASTRERDASVLRRFAATGVPIVLAVRWIHGLTLPRVTNDDLRGGVLAAEHLLGLGHTRVQQVHGPSDIETFRERCAGFRRALAAAGIADEEPTEHATAPTVAEGRRLMAAQLAASAAPPTAVFAHSDHLAIGAIEALHAVGLTCPGDVSVVGYNDMPLIEHLSPALSTVRMPTREIGRVAAQAVLAAIQGDEQAAAPISLQPALVLRGSTSPPAPARAGRGGPPVPHDLRSTTHG